MTSTTIDRDVTQCEDVKEGSLICVRKGCENAATLAVLTLHINQECGRPNWFTLCDECFAWVLSKIAELHDLIGEGYRPVCRFCNRRVDPTAVLLDVRAL